MNSEKINLEAVTLDDCIRKFMLEQKETAIMLSQSFCCLGPKGRREQITNDSCKERPRERAKGEGRLAVSSSLFNYNFIIVNVKWLFI